MNLNMNHLAMILDGNRRWGKAHGIKMSVDFYIQSGLLGLDVAKAAFNRGINHLSIWIGSVSNLTERPALELKALNKAYKKFFEDQKNLDFAHERQIKIDCIGRWQELLEPATVKAIEKAVTATAKYADSGRRLTVLIGYDGTEERGAALEKILGDYKRSNVLPETVRSDDEERAIFPVTTGENRVSRKERLIASAELLRQNSWTGHLPDVDLIIRTGCKSDPHNSAGFLSMLVDNAQYAFLDTLWPDFTPELLHQILDEFDDRERRMGK